MSPVCPQLCLEGSCSTPWGQETELRIQGDQDPEFEEQSTREERAAQRESPRDLQRMGIQQGTDPTYVKKLPKARERAIRNGSTVIPHYL